MRELQQDRESHHGRRQTAPARQDVQVQPVAQHLETAQRIFTPVSAGLLATDRILLNTTTGLLSFDADGNGKTGAVAFAQLPTAIASLVSASDFLIIA